MSIRTRNLLSRLYRAPTEGGDEGGDTSADTSLATVEGADVQTDWSDVSDDGGDTAVAVEPVADTPTAPAPAPTTVTPPATPAPAVAAEATPPQAPQVQETPQVQQPAAAPVDLAALRQNYQTELTNYYALDQADAQRLQTEPELVLPSLAAKVHLEVLDAVMAQLPQRVTQMITHHAEATKRERQAEEEFFAPFPDLKGHRDAVLRVGQMYRAANPKATKQEAITAIGNFVRQSLGIQPPAPVQTAPAVPNPFVPAGSSGGGAAPLQKSEWDFILEDD